MWHQIGMRVQGANIDAIGEEGQGLLVFWCIPICDILKIHFVYMMSYYTSTSSNLAPYKETGY